MSKFSIYLSLFFTVLYPFAGLAQDLSATAYEIGNPVLETIWVDPANGNDDQSGASRALALKTLTAAWNKIPEAQTLRNRGFKINLAAGVYAVNALPNYWESKHGTQEFPIILEAVDGAGTAVFRNGPNVFDVKYTYFIGIKVDSGGDAFHCEQCDHVLLRQVTLDGGDREAQETLKVNQSQYFFVEDSSIHGAGDNSIDFVAVQYGHVINSRVHNAQDWCMYVKGGSAYISISGNSFYNCGTGGFTAGQGTGFEFMTSPWLHYEAYDIKFVNNVIHDTEGAAFGVNGGYNILLAHNTAYRIGTRSHLFEAVYGARSCDGNVNQCSSNLLAGGWGTATTGQEGEPIPNKNVFVYNNIFYNPAGVQSGFQHLTVQGPRIPNGGSNIPSPARADENLQFRGNIIWNGPSNYSLGIEETDQGCQGGNSSCNQSQLVAENNINQFEPAFRDAANSDFRPSVASNILGATTYALPAFAGSDRPSPPLAPEGVLTNSVPNDRGGAARTSVDPAGAYRSSDSNLEDPGSGDEEDGDSDLILEKAKVSPRTAKAGQMVTLQVTVRGSGISRVTALVGTKATVTLRLSKGKYLKQWKAKKSLKPGKYPVSFTATADDGSSTTLAAGTLKIKR